MDFNIVTLEIADLITHFDYYDTLVSDALSKTAVGAEDQTKIRSKSREHLAEFFADVKFYNAQKQILTLSQIKGLIIAKLSGMKSAEIHGLVEKLEKDAKKMKKLYKSMAKS
jgi:hypothetical protein